MKTVLTAALLLTASLSFAATCPDGQIWQSCSGTSAGPGPCIPGCIGDSAPVAGPAELCLPDGCQPVQYSWMGDIVVAESMLMNGYSVLGWAGPCVHEDRLLCPNIFEQAFQDLTINALRSTRAQSF